MDYPHPLWTEKTSYPHRRRVQGDNPQSYPHDGYNSVHSLGIDPREHLYDFQNLIHVLLALPSQVVYPAFADV